jgi:uncharacterized membrane protein YdjX (TVP38/TMEM64 family)
MNAERSGSIARILLFAALLVGLFVAAQTIEIQPQVGALRGWLRGFGVWAPAVFVLGYALATTFGAPGTPLTILAAILFGPWLGVVTMIVASTLAAVIGFCLSRFVARSRLERLLAHRPAYEKLQGMVAASPVTAISFARLMPAFPFTFVNYALGLSRVSFGRYLLASELAMVPMNVVWVFSAGTVYRMVVRGETPWAILLASAGAAVGVLALMWMGRRRFSLDGGDASPPRSARGSRRARPAATHGRRLAAPRP